MFIFIRNSPHIVILHWNKWDFITYYYHILESQLTTLSADWNEELVVKVSIWVQDVDKGV